MGGTRTYLMVLMVACGVFLIHDWHRHAGSRDGMWIGAVLIGTAGALRKAEVRR